MSNIKLITLSLTFLVLILCVQISKAEWVRVSNGIGGNRPVLSFASTGNYIFAGTYLFGNGGVFLSTNNGTSWIQTSLINRDIYSLAVKVNVIFAGTEGYGIYKSTNNGITWTQTYFNEQVISSLAVKGNDILAGTYSWGDGGVFLSTNDGTSWIQTLNNGEVLSLATNENYVFAGTNGYGVFKSTNNGTSWTQTSLGNFHSIYSLAANGSNIFAGCYSQGVESIYKSTNNGTSWIQTSLINLHIYSLAVYGNSIFAGTNPNSCYVSTNNGTSWTIRNDGFPEPDYITVRAFCILNNFIFAGTSNSNFDGIYRRPLSELVGIKPISEQIPEHFALEQNYPNPFNATTKIRFDVASVGAIHELPVRLIIYDILGREAATLVNEHLNPGTYEVEWNASNYPSGVYYYKLSAGDFTETKKMVLLK